MFLKNFYSVLGSCFCSGTVQPSITYHKGTVTKIGSGSAAGDYWNPSESNGQNPYLGRMITATLSTANLSTSATQTANTGVILGDGNTPVTFEDYCLSGNQITGFSYSQSITKELTDNGECRLNCLYTITNANSEAITVSEIGLIAGVSSGSSTYALMVERTVLDESITIEAGGVGVINYMLTLKYPTA